MRESRCLEPGGDRPLTLCWPARNSHLPRPQWPILPNSLVRGSCGDQFLPGSRARVQALSAVELEGRRVGLDRLPAVAASHRMHMKSFRQPLTGYLETWQTWYSRLMILASSTHVSSSRVQRALCTDCRTADDYLFTPESCLTEHLRFWRGYSTIHCRNVTQPDSPLECGQGSLA